MKEFVYWLLRTDNSRFKIELFNEWHILFLFISFSSAFLMAYLFKGKGEQARNKLLRFYAYITIITYAADFFLMPLCDFYEEIAIDKLPFHICTLMSVCAAFVQFNPRLKFAKTSVVILSLVSSLMWMTYPGTALGGRSPFCYQIVQTFIFHTFLFSWAFLNIALGEVKLNIRECWKELVGILLITAWAYLGNTLYDKNWFFLMENPFSFVPDELAVVSVIAAVFLMCLLIYGIYYLVLAISERISIEQNKRKRTKGI